MRERDAGGNGGGFAALEASPRRVAGVSRLYWCNSPRLQAAGGVWVFRTVCFERVVLSSPGCLWPGRMDDHEEVLEAHA